MLEGRQCGGTTGHACALAPSMLFPPWRRHLASALGDSVARFAPWAKGAGREMPMPNRPKASADGWSARSS
jgi:hypothetical protein